LPAAAVALLAVLLLDGAITNPAGFAKRVAFLTGPASQTYAEYWHGPLGWAALLTDMMRYYTRDYGLLAVVFTGVGVWLTWRRRNVAGFLPLLAIISFTLCFNFAALRSDDRFLLPQGVLACVYIGIAVEMIGHARPWLRRGAQAVVAVIALLALHQAIAIAAAMLFDPRYNAERWMAAHVRPGDTVETYGQNAYLPRFPHDATVMRVGTRPPQARSPLPGVTELQEPFDAHRAPHFIVVNDWWMRHYTKPQSELGGHRLPSPVQAALYADMPARFYFRALEDGGVPYRLALRAGPASSFWPQVHIHESLNEAILIYERAP
jgi:hypothetical protein